jgi:CRISPR-associated protein Cas1
MLRNRGGFDFSGRNRRPPRDPVNATLSFLYALLVRDCVAALLSVGLEPGLGLFHRVRLGRPSLALDLAEEFRPLIADSIALSALNTGELVSTHFVQRGLGVALTDTGRRAAIGAYERRMGQEVIHELFGYALSYRRVLAIQARLLARCLEGDIPAYPAFTTR